MTYVLFANRIQKSCIISYIVVLVLKLSGMILNCFGSPVLKSQLILLSKTLYLVCYQDRAPYLTIFSSYCKNLFMGL